jgi:hypothetical protein
LKKQIVDQTAHYIAAIVILLLTLLPYGFIVSGFLIGFVREQGQRWITNRPNAWKFWAWGRGSWIDMTFWTLGGITAEILFRLIL